MKSVVGGHMNGQKALLCKICANQIKGEYVIHEKNGIEEYYHSQCAKDKQLQLPITIKFGCSLTYMMSLSSFIGNEVFSIF